MQFFDKLRPVGLLLLRWALAVVFVYHGYPKLFSRVEFFQQAFAQYGLPPYLSYVAGIIEFFGGLLLFVGLFTRVASLLLTAEMGFAIWRIHLGEGILAVPEYEFALVAATGAFALTCFGAGVVSLDYALFRQKA